MTLGPQQAYITSAFKHLAEVGIKLDQLSDAEISALRKSGDLERGPKLRLTFQGFHKLEQQREIYRLQRTANEPA